MSVIKLVRNDTRPALVCTITDASTGGPIVLTGATCRLKFRKVNTTTLIATLTGTVVDPTNGVVEFYWAADPVSLESPAGQYEGEVEITFQDGQIQTVFDTLNFIIRQDF